jgi:hypothetical protein
MGYMANDGPQQRVLDALFPVLTKGRAYTPLYIFGTAFNVQIILLVRPNEHLL